MRIYRLLPFIVVILALLDVLFAMRGGEPKTFKTQQGMCLTFNRVTTLGNRKSKRLRLETCALNNDDPDQWIFIRKINKNEGVFYNYAGNQVIGYNSNKNKFQIIDRVDLYRGGKIPFLDQSSPSYYLRSKLENLWRKYEKCKRKKRHCSKKRKWRLKNKIKLFLKHKDADKLVTRNEAKWIIQRPRLKIRHRERKNAKIENMHFNLQDKYYGNGYYQILVNLNDSETIAMKEKFM
ncbi:UNVERIFIED_CONTAM: hypothetical protein RMT77_012475 [Armadillidium vulgare]